MEFVDEPGYRLKLRRANEHLDAINSKARAFVKNNLSGAQPFDPEPEDQWTILRHGYVEPLSPLWGTYLGDFIHNARSALDNLVCAMIRLNDPSHGVEHAYFPAYDGRKQWVSEIVNRNREIDRLAPTDGVSDAVLASIERSQPYHITGVSMSRTPMMMLQAASNTDKHQTIHATTARIAGPREVIPGVKIPRGNLRIVPSGYFQIRKQRPAAPGTPIETGAEIGRMKVRTLRMPPPDVQVGVHTHIPMEIAFSVEAKTAEMTHWDIWAMISEAWRIVLRVEHAAGIDVRALPLPHDEWTWHPENS